MPVRVLPGSLPLPRLLYKYLPPNRLTLLAHCRIRISQRQAVNDPVDFTPEVRRLGDDADVTALFEDTVYAGRLPTNFPPEVLQQIRNSPALQQQMLAIARSALRTPDELGMLCLTDTPHSGEMWARYAAGGEGFVVGFDPILLLPLDGILGRVEYDDSPIETFLRDFALNAFYRKGEKWSYENEWRYVRRLERCERDGVDPNGDAVYLLRFSPTAVVQLIARGRAKIAAQLHQFAAIDARYSHVQVVEQ